MPQPIKKDRGDALSRRPAHLATPARIALRHQRFHRRNAGQRKQPLIQAIKKPRRAGDDEHEPVVAGQLVRYQRSCVPWSCRVRFIPEVRRAAAREARTKGRYWRCRRRCRRRSRRRPSSRRRDVAGHDGQQQQRWSSPRRTTCRSSARRCSRRSSRPCRAGGSDTRAANSCPRS